MAHKQESVEPYIVITCEEAFAQDTNKGHVKGQDPFSGPWKEQTSAKWSDPIGYSTTKLRSLFPGHSVVSFTGIDVLGFPGALIAPVAPSEMVKMFYYFSVARQAGQSTGVLVQNVRFGSFRVAWASYDFQLYTTTFIYGFGEWSVQFLIHDGPEEPIKRLLSAAGIWTNELHDEIYVFDSGFWQKDHALWLEVQKANWGDVILKAEFKKRLQKDVLGFFESEELYKKLAIPWKRGIIMHGPPGNGKTISMKAIMKDCQDRNYYPLYVKSFRSWKGEEGAMTDVFEKARQVAPCVVILEDLDSLINNQNRSFFLNQIDGLSNNDGLLVIGTTNHLDSIDPALRSRPSRFDRKFMFDDPDTDERKLYVQYWQNKLKSNKDISFPDSLVDEVVKQTTKFSFAYLKEAFVSTLVILAGLEDDDGDKATFETVLLAQIKTLKAQLGKDKDEHDVVESPFSVNTPRSLPPPPVPARFPHPHRRVDTQTQMQLDSNAVHMHVPGEMPPNARGDERRDVRSTALAAARLGRSYFF